MDPGIAVTTVVVRARVMALALLVALLGSACSSDPEPSQTFRWLPDDVSPVMARAPNPGRGKIPVSVSGAGDTEIAALVDLHGRLTGMPRPADDAARRATLNRRLRQAFYQGAEEQAASDGGSLDDAALRRVLRRYPGDL